MYSTTINPKVNAMVADIRKKVSRIVAESSSSREAVDAVTQLVSSELSIRSQTMMSDMLFDLSDNLMKTAFFSEISKQNRFYEIDLRQEIFSKYHFAPSTTVNYQEAARELQALKVGGAVFLAGGVIELGTVLAAGLSLSRLVPIPISLLIAASMGAALADYYAVEPARNKKKLVAALDEYLVQAQKQFLGWFDEVEKFFNMRVEEIKQTL